MLLLARSSILWQLKGCSLTTAAFELMQGSATFAEADFISFGLLLEIKLLLVTFGSASSVVSANCCYVLLTHSEVMKNYFRSETECVSEPETNFVLYTLASQIFSGF
ncbi:hypothetical protein [Caldicellulosiruptor kronotskyensis]|nr:hypothetical protein [Caldicellulosiruptor kronotskyensis]